MAKKEQHKNDLLENPEALAHSLEDAEHWLEKHSKTVTIVAGAALLIVAGYFGFNYYKSSQNAQAQKEMFQAVYYFEADSLDLALKGDGNNLGFLDIINEYGITEAGNLSHFYAGYCLLKQGKYEDAISQLKEFSSNDLLVQPRAYSLIGDAYMELKKFDDAASYYSKAADYKPNKYFTPAYLMKVALAYEKLNQNDKAKEAYDKVITNYWESTEYQNARKYKARLESNS
ncbi:MAG TPA: tetratricopeptide repeat protein [Cyclobacteriaceae bacterium]